MKTSVIKLGPYGSPNVVIAQLVTTPQEYEVLKLALKHYNNGYGNSVLRKIRKAEES